MKWTFSKKKQRGNGELTESSADESWSFPLLFSSNTVPLLCTNETGRGSTNIDVCLPCTALLPQRRFLCSQQQISRTSPFRVAFDHDNFDLNAAQSSGWQSSLSSCTTARRCRLMRRTCTNPMQVCSTVDKNRPSKVLKEDFHLISGLPFAAVECSCLQNAFKAFLNAHVAESMAF